MMIRLNKYIADSGFASRRKAEEFIIQGRVSVNKKIITDLSFKVNYNNDEVFIDGEKIEPKKHLYYLLNKPKGVISTTSDEKNRMTVVDLIKSSERIYPIGRLDYNTTGVLILTNDGDFKNFLTHPTNNIPREYEVKLDKSFNIKDKEKLLKGIYIKNEKARFTKIILPDKRNNKILEVTCIEGRNHFVKNMFGSLGYRVVALNRKSFAGIKANIPLGSFRKLSNDEIKKVLEVYGN